MLTQFDAFLIVFFLIIAAIIIGAAGMVLDNILDPGCDCATKRRQEGEAGGVEL